MKKYGNNRVGRISDQIQKDIADILRFKVKDPRVVGVTINEVVVNHDYSLAKVYWTILKTNKKSEVAKALDVATGFIRSELSKGFKTYTIPQVRFIYDESLEHGNKILDIFKDIKYTTVVENDLEDSLVKQNNNSLESDSQLDPDRDSNHEK